jgi:ribulose-phosphate 3-epimerase
MKEALKKSGVSLPASLVLNNSMVNLHEITYPALSPSLLAADSKDLNGEVAKAIKANCPFIHFDVMDGRFVPAVSFSSSILASFSPALKIIRDVHIMIEEPYKQIEEFAYAGADIITFHYEACLDMSLRLLTISEIKKNDVNPGMSIKPDTPVSVLAPYLDKLSLVLLMSVEPGKGGQAFIEDSIERIKELRKMIDALPKANRPLLEVDGGINEITGPEAIKAGADILVAGSYLYGHHDFGKRCQNLLSEEEK